MQGWIKLHRKLLDNPIMKKPELLQLFMYCLLRANHEPETIIFGEKEVQIKRGSFLTGRYSLEADLGCKAITLYKRLQKLKNLDFVTLNSNNKFTVVTVVNWELYQSAEEESNSKSNNKITSKEHQSNTNKNDKNDKNDKKLKDICGDKSPRTQKFTPPTIEEVKEYCLQRNNNVDPEKWIDHYTAKGWMIGKNKMKDWKAAVRTWERGNNSQKQQSKSTLGMLKEMYEEAGDE